MIIDLNKIKHKPEYKKLCKDSIERTERSVIFRADLEASRQQIILDKQKAIECFDLQLAEIDEMLNLLD